jgi:hypothetical protein
MSSTPSARYPDWAYEQDEFINRAAQRVSGEDVNIYFEPASDCQQKSQFEFHVEGYGYYANNVRVTVPLTVIRQMLEHAGYTVQRTGPEE